MAHGEDPRTSMKYLGHLRGVALAGVRLIQEKTRTYGPSWKRRLGPGAWFTTVRPWDRLENIVEQYGGDIFAAIEAHPLGGDGTALDAIRDVRNYTLLIEAEMVARGTIADPGCQAEEETQRLTDAARNRPSPLDEAPVVTQDTQSALGAGAVVGGCYTSLDIGESRELWHEGMGAVPEKGQRTADIGLTIAAMNTRDTLEPLQLAGALVASRILHPSGDLQILIRIPRDPD